MTTNYNVPNEAALQRRINEALERMWQRSIAESQRFVDGIYRHNAGKSMNVVAAVIREKLRARRWELSEQEIRTIAAAIANRHPISMKGADIMPMSIQPRKLVVRGPSIKVRFATTGNVVEGSVHCSDADTGKIGVVSSGFPPKMPHLVIYPHEAGEQHEREYDPAELPELTAREDDCPYLE